MEATLDERESISVVARRIGVAPNLLYRSRRLMLEGGSVAVSCDDEVTSNKAVRQMEDRILELERQLGPKTLVKVNPTRARRCAQAISQGAKTDRVDAAMLARMGAVLDLESTPVRSETMYEIRELHVARLALNKDRTACRNRLECPASALMGQIELIE